MAHDVAIIGAGFSGIAAGLALRRAAASARVQVFDRTGTFGPGVAYGTQSPLHLLNVAADLLGAHADDQSGFKDWLGAHAAAVVPFPPRALYGRYLAECVEQAAARSQGALRCVRANIDRIERAGRGFRLRDAEGREHRADAVVLATGHGSPRVATSVARDGATSSRVLLAWRDQDRIASLAEDAVVLCIGTGLTMIDMALTALEEHGARRFIAMSSHGFTPQPHTSTPGADARGSLLVQALEAAPRTTAARLRAFREFLASDPQLDWRDAITALRPRLPDLWCTLPHAERRRFLRHVRAWWEIHRHRCAPQVVQRIEDLQVSGRLAIVAGRIDEIAAADDGFNVRYRARGRAAQRAVRADAVIDATPPCSDIGELDEPLVRNLLAAGLVRADPLRLGIETDALGRVVGADGHPIERLYYVGPWLRARDWEATAVAELRACATASARALAAELKDS